MCHAGGEDLYVSRNVHKETDQYQESSSRAVVARRWVDVVGSGSASMARPDQVTAQLSGQPRLPGRAGDPKGTGLGCHEHRTERAHD